jgi:predicted ArsR family transcriptional regulator
MPSREAYEKTLDKLASLLRKKPMTAKQIAERLGCCKPVAYERLKSLTKRGDKLYTTKVREGSVGPKSIAYGLDH